MKSAFFFFFARLKISQFSSVQSLSHVWLFATAWTTAHQASLSITNSRSPPKPMTIVSVMPSSHLILCCPLLLLPPSLPASGSFPVSQLFTSGGQSIGVSASSGLLVNPQDWSPLGWTGWVSLQKISQTLHFQNYFFFSCQNHHQPGLPTQLFDAVYLLIEAYIH